MRVPVYEVMVDDRTGEPHSEPAPTLGCVDLVEWRKRRDYDCTQYRVIEYKGQTCALVVHRVNGRSYFSEVTYNTVS
jgi:hypothetical protein